MKPSSIVFSLACLATAHPASAHSWKAGEADRDSLRAHILAEWRQSHPQPESGEIKPLRVASATSSLAAAAAAIANAASAPVQSKAFQMFPKLELRWDNDFLFIGGHGMPDHNMMVGITAWQQQVPLPQDYTGDNAWRIPLHPVVAKTPAVVENHFLRGAIAIGVNGIPIFNPQNNRGEVSYEIGELDQWGGHCGRADDYHYHIAPLHLESVVGKGMPIAYALDGYPVYGLTEPDGSPVGKLDECHGHEDAKVGYHYHASTKRPYLQSAFHGEVVEADGQVDPQPRAQPVRESLRALRGAKITGFESTGPNSYKLSYNVNGDKRSVAYTIKEDGTYPFAFDNGREGKTSEVYTARRGGGGRDQGQGAPPKRKGEDRPPPVESPPAAANKMDTDGDGVVSAAEFAEAARRQFALGKAGGTLAEALQKAKEQFLSLDHNKDGVLDSHELEELASNTPPPKTEPNERPMRKGEEPAQPKGMKRGGGGGKREAFVPSADQPRSSNGTFLLTSPEVEDLKEMPADYTGDGSGATLPLAWKSAPTGTQSYVLIMDHTDPEGQKKWYWTVYDIPPTVTSFPKNVQGIGKVGTGFKGQIGYEPPHSKGPGAKTYVLTLYALSSPLKLTQAPSKVNREILLAAIKGKVLASSSLRVVHTGKGNDAAGPDSGQRPARREGPSGGADRPREGRRPPPEGSADAASAPDKRPSPPEAPGGQRKPWIQMHGAELDADHDGVVTMDEVTADMKRAFAMYDRDKDGVITPAEIEAAGDIREGAAFAGFIYRHAIELDANNDSRLTLAEAMAAAKHIFDSADQDHDGKLTAAEIQSAANAPLPVPSTVNASAPASAPPPREDSPPAGPGARGGEGKGKGSKGGPDNKGLIKPTMADTIKVNVYADNWFVLFINGKLTAVDSIEFTPHNVVTIDILPEYPMTIAVMAKDNADPKTGLEYGDHVGDGGFIIKFADGTVSNATWKAKNFFKGPLNHDTKNPVVVHTPIPDKWWTVDFDDSSWPNATEFTEERVNPKEPFYQADFAGARFIWSDDLDLDNTVIFRTKIEKPGWKPRWNTHSDMDMTGAPFK